MRKITENSELQAENDRYVSSLYTACKDMTLNSSQFGDDRPLSCVRYNPNGSQVASGSLSSYIKIWDVSNLACISTLHSHEERITSLSWCPQSSGAITNFSPLTKLLNLYVR